MTSAGNRGMLNGLTRRWIGTIAVFAAFSTPGAQANFQVSPMSVTFSPEGNGATQSFVIQNDSNEKMAIQVNMGERKMLPDGREEYRDANTQFTVFPDQLILAPKSARSVRVAWVGEKKPSQELAYRLIAEQLPVDSQKNPTKGHAAIRILLRYIASVYINPPGTQPKVELEALTQVMGKDNQPRLAIDVINRGTRHQVLDDAVLSIHGTGSDSSSVELGAKELNGMIGENILAGAKRRFLIPWPKGIPTQDIRGDLKAK